MSVISQSAGLLFRIDSDASGVKRDLAAVDASIGSLGSKFTSFGGIASIATAGIAAFGVATLAVGKSLFDLTSAASAFGSEIFDISKKTGLGATAISSLKAAAEQSGSSLEAVSKGIAKFAKQYEGTGTDLRAELGKTFAQIAAAKPGFEQLTLAQEKFGKSGADLIPMILSFDGDLEGLIKRMEDLGITIDDEAAAAADAFGDQMDILGAQMAGVGRTIGTAFMPQFTRMAASVSGWLVQNKENISTFATVTANAFSTLLRGLESVASWMQRNQKLLEFIFNTSTGGVWGLVMSGINGEINRLSQPGPGTIQEASGSGRSGGFDPDKVPAVGRKGGGGKSAADNAEREEEERRRKAVQMATDEMQETLGVYQAGYAARLQLLDFNLAQKYTSELNYIRDVGRIHLEALMDEKTLNQELLRNENLSVEEKKKIANKIKILEIEIRTEKSKTATKVIEQIDKQTKAEEEAHQKELKRLQEISDKRQRNFLAWQLERQERLRALREEERSRSLAGIAAAGGGGFLDNIKDEFDANGNLISQGLGVIGSAFLQLKEIGMGALNALAQGIGSMVQSWVLMGNTGGQTFRKLAAQVLASVAMQAATMAILCLAYAALATTAIGAAILGGTPVQFLWAAALFGAIAVGTAVAGRLVAGDAFKQQTQIATGQSSTSENSGQGSAGKAGPYSGNPDRVLEGSINSPGRGGLLGMLGIKVIPSDQYTVEIVETNIKNNGSLRLAIQDI